MIKIENVIFDISNYRTIIDNFDSKSWGNITRRIFSKIENKRPFIRAVNGKTNILFNRIFDCAEYFKLSNEKTYELIKTMRNTDCGWTLTCIFRGDPEARKYARDSLVSRSGDSSDKFKKNYKRGVDMMNLITGEVKNYPSMAAAAKHHGVMLTHIRNSISNDKKHSVVLNHYVVVDSGYGFNFLTVELKKKLLSRAAKPIVVINAKDKTYEEFKSIRAFVEAKGFGEQRSHISDMLTGEKYIRFKGYYIAFKQQGKNVDSSLQLIFDICGIKSSK